MKKLTTFIFLILLINFFGLNYDADLLVAIKLSQNGNYTEAEDLYKALFEEYPTSEIVLHYSNMLAWSGRIDQAIELILGYKDKNTELLANLAKFYFWSGDFDNSYSTYKKLIADNFVPDESASNFINWYENYNKFNVGIGYSSEIINENRNHNAGLNLKYD